jgi:DNA primase
MSGTLERTADGVWFAAEARRYRELSPLQRHPRGHVVLTLALYHGPGDACLHQDEVDTSVAKGRLAFGRQCPGLEAQVIAQDLLALDAAVREELDREAAPGGGGEAEVAAPPGCGNIEEGEDAYFRVQTAPDGRVQRTRLSSFVIVPKLRVWVDGTEAVRADLQLPEQTIPDVTFERHHWHSRGLFLKALPGLDLWCVASTPEIQHIQGIVAGKPVPRKRGTRTLGSCDGGLWVTSEGVLNAQGWMADPPVLYLPHGGACPLGDAVRYRADDPETGRAVARAVYAQVWSLHAVGVIGPLLGWFFATPFKVALQHQLGHFPILNCWGTPGGGKTSLLQLLWRLFGVDSPLLSCTETEFALLTLFASTTSIPLVFDEFKPRDMAADAVKRFERLLRCAYTGELEHRGRPDRRLVPYHLTAPVAVAGEVPVASQPALAERVIAVSPSPQWLATHAEARDAFRQLMALPLAAFAGLYIPWTLQRAVEPEIADADHVLQEVLGARVLPARVHDNLQVITFGLLQCARFAEDLQILLPAPLDLPALLAPLVEHLCAPDGPARTAVDHLLEHLATLAEMGRLRRGLHYQLTAEGALALRLDLCLAEFRHYVREAKLDTEVLSRAAYLQQLRENVQAKGYIKHTSERSYFGRQRQRAVVIDRALAEHAGLDLGGFAAE